MDDAQVTHIECILWMPEVSHAERSCNKVMDNFEVFFMLVRVGAPSSAYLVEGRSKIELYDGCRQSAPIVGNTVSISLLSLAYHCHTVCCTGYIPIG